ncbi:brefeldin A-inhibited guanine nucleotide-exchange protein 3-like [Stegodyphus dumicola]|uniref:brefeldin A-inhibited guanine nucleotide-exchange protein 3-like n=1 Tax=Stegodyphus dumicola TaxID=202533 RepID=UPI0015AAF89B|nr:brefeldin A-inhibited guanine nucleotide-exchange protein 3-like [Stegodyphus dumicola]
MLLQGTQYMLPILMTLLPSENPVPYVADEVKKPGFLSKLSTGQLQILSSCLEDSYEVACNFDLRPGLKFLIQKVAQTDVAANLYKQAGLSWTIHMVVLFELCMSISPLTLEFVKASICHENGAAISDSDSSKSDGHLMASVPAGNSEQETSSENNFNEFVMLRDKFRDICELYTEHTIDKEGLGTLVDKMSEQPIFFLATPIDEMNDFLFPSKQTESYSAKNENKEEVPPQVCYDSSDSEDLTNIHEDETKDKIYTLATEQTINSLISEYKKRKNQHSMPSKMKEKLSRKCSSSAKRNSSNSSLPGEIATQRRNSIMKDGEAHLQVFKQLIQSVLDLHQSLANEQFKAFLPVFFPGIQFLVAYASDRELRLAISEWLQRLAVCCNFHV